MLDFRKEWERIPADIAWLTKDISKCPLNTINTSEGTLHCMCDSQNPCIWCEYKAACNLSEALFGWLYVLEGRSGGKMWDSLLNGDQ